MPSLESDYLRPEHLPGLAALDRRICSDPWSQYEFRAVARQNRVFCRVMLADGVVIGYLIARKDRRRYTLLKLGADPAWASRGLPTFIVREFLLFQLTPARPVVALDVPERDLAVHLWLRRLGFVAIGVTHAVAPTTDDEDGEPSEGQDVIHFEYRRPLDVPLEECQGR